jgi:hypothetical protein
LQLCVRDAAVKSRIVAAGALPGLIRLSEADDSGAQKLAACALCNLVANHPANKRQASRLGLVRAMGTLCKRSEVAEVQCAAASCIFNLCCRQDKAELEALALLPTLRAIKSTRHIDKKLACNTTSVGEANSPAFGTF